MRTIALLLICASAAFAQFGNANRVQGVPVCTPLTQTNGYVFSYNSSTGCLELAVGGSAVLSITSPDGSILVGGTSSAPTLQVAPTTEPGFSANQILSGCGVEYVSALVFNV